MTISIECIQKCSETISMVSRHLIDWLIDWTYNKTPRPISDQPHVPGQADLPDAPEQIHQVHGLCDLHAVQLRLQPARGVPAAQALQDGAAGGDQVSAGPY